MIKYLSNVHKIEGANLQCVNDHYAKFECKEIRTVGVTDYTNQTPPKQFGRKKMSKFNTPPPPPQKENIHEMCAKRYTSSMC